MTTDPKVNHLDDPSSNPSIVASWYRRLQSKAIVGSRACSRSSRFDARPLRLLVRIGSHAAAKRRQLLLGFCCHASKRIGVAGCPRSFHKAAIQFAEPLQHRVSPFAAQGLRSRPRAVQLAHDLVEDRVERPVDPGPPGGETRDHLLEMRRQRFTRPRPARYVRGVRRLVTRNLVIDADGASPVVECVQDVGFAELHADRPAPWPLCVVALEVPVDAAKDHFQRNPPGGPPAHLLEGWPDDPDQVAVVLAAQVRLDGATVLRRCRSRFLVLSSQFLFTFGSGFGFGDRT